MEPRIRKKTICIISTLAALAMMPLLAFSASGPLVCTKITTHKAKNPLAPEFSEKEVVALIRNFTRLSNIASEEEIVAYFSKQVPLFQEFASKQPSARTPDIHMVHAFFEYHTKGYLDKSWLKQEQEKSLAAQLRNWQIEIESSDGYTALKSLSSSNLEDVSMRLNLQPLDQLPPQISNLAASIKLEFRHNTAFYKVHGPVMLSSARMKSLGLDVTTQSKEDFNKHFVQSDDQLYFYVQPSVSDMGHGPKKIESRYGVNSFYLDRDYASEFGWISPYIMDSGDINLYRSSLKRAGFDTNNLSDAEILGKLKQNIYTVADFTKLYRLIVANYIAGNIEQKGHMPSSQRLAKILSNPRYYTGNDALIDLRNLMSEMGISGGLMELKIPAAFESRFLQSAK